MAQPKQSGAQKNPVFPDQFQAAGFYGRGSSGHEVHVSAYQLVRRHNTETDGEDVVRDPTETDGLVSESRRADFSHDAVRQGADGQVKGEDPGEHHTYEFQHSQKTMECGEVMWRSGG